MKVALGLGSSLGPRRARLELVLRMLDASPGLRLIRASRWYRTPPLRGGAARNWFLNGVALLESERSGQELLALCVGIERRFGRRRALHWGDRTLDLDILLMEGQVLSTPDLVVPHPAIASRPFVLGPLVEVWPDAIDPHTGRRWGDLPTPPGPRPTGIGVARRPTEPLPPAGAPPPQPGSHAALPGLAQASAATTDPAPWLATSSALEPPPTSLDWTQP